MTKDSKPWIKKDHDTLVGIIASFLDQGHYFKTIASNSPLTDIFTIQKPDEFGLGILLGAIISEFNHYWINEYGEAPSKKDVEFLLFQIGQVADFIRNGLDK